MEGFDSALNVLPSPCGINKSFFSEKNDRNIEENPLKIEYQRNIKK